MFPILKFEPNSGEFSEVAALVELAEAVRELQLRNNHQNYHILTWMNPAGLSGEEEDKVLADVLKANQGRVLRVLKNAISHIEALNGDRVCCSSDSNCFCVTYANGTRQCETQYCNASGYCWWVPCNVPCGC